jgi:DNA processing protein
MISTPEKELYYRIALTQTEQLGEKLGRLLLNHFGTATAIYDAPVKQIKAIDGFGEKRIESFRNNIDEPRIKEEMQFIAKHNITPLFITDSQYPQKLKACADAPLLLYYKGTADLNAKKMVAIIGTRKNTEYGARVTEELIEGLRQLDVIVVSGLAFGIDVIAHRKAIQQGISTLGVVAHGLDSIYPTQHKHIANEMLKNGGLLTEYISGTRPERFNFPMRNRIVAGMCDVTVVVETEKTGGSMITAKLAASYNRDVAAFPGRTIDRKSQGCNYLIHTHMAEMITNADDLLDMMNWNTPEKTKTVQPKLFTHLTDEETKIADILRESEGMHIDEIFLKAGVGTSTLSSLLLTMELGGALKALPGKRYRLI